MLPAHALRDLDTANFDPFCLVSIELFEEELRRTLPQALCTAPNVALLVRLRELFLEMRYGGAFCAAEPLQHNTLFRVNVWLAQRR